MRGADLLTAILPKVFIALQLVVFFILHSSVYDVFFILKSIPYLLNISLSLGRPKSQRLNVFAKHFSSIQGPVEL